MTLRSGRGHALLRRLGIIIDDYHLLLPLLAPAREKKRQNRVLCKCLLQNDPLESAHQRREMADGGGEASSIAAS